MFDALEKVFRDTDQVGTIGWGGGERSGDWGKASNDLMHSIRFYSGSTHQPSLPRKIERLREMSRGLRTYHNATTKEIIIFP